MDGDQRRDTAATSRSDAGSGRDAAGVPASDIYSRRRVLTHVVETSNAEVPIGSQPGHEVLAPLAAAQAAARAKSAFLLALIGELRDPLNALMGFAELTQRDRREPTEERQRQRAQHILAAGEDLRLLLQGVEEWALIDDGEVAVRRERIDVIAILQRVRSALSQAASRAAVRLIVEPSPARDLPTPLGDPAQLFQVLMEFGSNAIEHNRPRGSVTFTAAASAEHLRLSVADTGPGVPVEKQDELFQPFVRAGRGKSGVPGRALGLAISRRRAERMQGRVGFCNLPEGGTKFWIDLPLDRG